MQMWIQRYSTLSTRKIHVEYLILMFLKLETDKKQKKYVNMHMQTKFFLWEGLVELLLWKLRTIFIFVKKKSLSNSFKFPRKVETSLDRSKSIW